MLARIAKPVMSAEMIEIPLINIVDLISKIANLSCLLISVLLLFVYVFIKTENIYLAILNICFISTNIHICGLVRIFLF